MKISPDINFRNYLKHELDRRLENNSAYSMRAFARDLQIPASRLSEFLRGKSGVSLLRAKEIISHLKLTKTETIFLNDLVISEFGRTELARNNANKRILSHHKNTMIPITFLDYEEICDWYYFAILTYLSHVEINIDYVLLANKIGISEDLCQFAIGRLVRKGLITNINNIWKTTNKSMTIDTGKANTSVQKHHKQFALEGIKSFSHCNFNEREFNSGFLMLTDDEIQNLRVKIKNAIISAFQEANENSLRREEQEKLTNQDLKLYGLGVQFFPIKTTKTKG